MLVKWREEAAGEEGRARWVSARPREWVPLSGRDPSLPKAWEGTERPEQAGGGGTGWNGDGFPRLGAALARPELGRAWCAPEDASPGGLEPAEEGVGAGAAGRACHSHLRSSRLLVGQARCWPGAFWVLCRQASMAELGARSGARSAAGSL